MSTFSKPEIIGLSGTFASGKDTLATYLASEHGYLHVSQGDILRREAMARYGSTERPVLHELANELRHTKGAGYLTEMIITEYRDKKAAGAQYTGVVISGMRSIGEAKTIRANGGVIVFTDAPVEVRYKRMEGRSRDSETQLSLEQFIAREATEMTTPGAGQDDAAFNVAGIRDMADVVLYNTDDVEAFLSDAAKQLGL